MSSMNTTGSRRQGVQRTDPRTLLRTEGLAVLALTLWGYFLLDGPLWLLAALALAPDIAMVGYLAGPRVGSRGYNNAHTYTGPAMLGAAGLWLDVSTAVLVALIWTGHIGADRLLGYGLNYGSGFGETHLSTRPAPVETLTESE